MHYLQLPFGIAAGCAVAVMLPLAWHRAPPDHVPTVAELRAEGPAILPIMLDQFDRMTTGPNKDAVEHMIDEVAAQRYATVSRLYWYTDLAAAKAAAAAQHKPILSLRLLGRLDDELSCANSRLFRTTLYANAKVSALMRDNFILHWSSERPVPKVTIDFGDGRKLERTTTGNSAHYVLDDDGRVLDVLPGLYAAPTFMMELQRARDLAASVRGMTDDDRARTIVAYHRTWAQSLAPRFGDATMVARAQRITVGKGVMERRDLRRYAPETRPGPDDVEGWIEIGSRQYDGTLDASSRRLVERLLTVGRHATRAELDAVIERLQRSIVGDTAINEQLLRPQISQLIITGLGRLPFGRLNDQIYSIVFHTPKSDPWLGLLPRTDFTGLPGDGVVLP